MGVADGGNHLMAGSLSVSINQRSSGICGEEAGAVTREGKENIDRNRLKR